MYFALCCLTFETNLPPVNPRREQKELAALAEKIRKKYRISVLHGDLTEKSGSAALYLACLDRRREQLDRKLDQICATCEESGFGRVSMEKSFLEHFDALDYY